MHPFDKIPSRDREAFPFQEFLKYPRCFMVDWKASVIDVFNDFAKAAGMKGVQLTIDPATRMPTLLDGRERVAFALHDKESAQHGILGSLQMYFGIRHSIRYLNHVAHGDTAYFVVESSSTWKRLESAFPHVKWFFTPIEKLPDVFRTDFGKLVEIGQRYADS